MPEVDRQPSSSCRASDTTSLGIAFESPPSGRRGLTRSPWSKRFDRPQPKSNPVTFSRDHENIEFHE